MALRHFKYICLLGIFSQDEAYVSKSMCHSVKKLVILNTMKVEKETLGVFSITSTVLGIGLDLSSSSNNNCL